MYDPIEDLEIEIEPFKCDVCHAELEYDRFHVTRRHEIELSSGDIVVACSKECAEKALGEKPYTGPAPVTETAWCDSCGEKIDQFTPDGHLIYKEVESRGGLFAMHPDCAARFGEKP